MLCTLLCVCVYALCCVVLFKGSLVLANLHALIACFRLPPTGREEEEEEICEMRERMKDSQLSISGSSSSSF